MVSVITPTYNRGHVIKNLYRSLSEQTNKNFEWIIVDDGSTDNTKKSIEKIIEKYELNIKYFYKENGGKHTALNLGVDNASGNCIFIVDSDDVLEVNAIEFIEKNFREISDNDKIAGMGALKCYKNGEVIGDSFPKDKYLRSILDVTYKDKILGDKALIFKTEILKSYRFPVFKNEKFLTEAVVYNRMANDNYLIEWYNEKIYIVEYLSDGLTNKYDSIMLQSWNGTKLYFNELLNSNIDFLEKKKYVYPEMIKYYISKNEFRDLIRKVNMPLYSIVIGMYKGFLLKVKKNIKILLNLR